MCRRKVTVGEAWQAATERLNSFRDHIEMEKKDREKKNVLEMKRLEIEEQKLKHEMDEDKKDHEEQKEIQDLESKEIQMKLDLKKLSNT